MKDVTENEFLEYFKNKIYTIEPGNIFHSENFIINNEIIGYKESSSWSTNELYKLKYATKNTETISFINTLFNNKK